MVKVTDYIADTLTQRGVRDVFGVTGGGAMHLGCSLGTHPKLDFLYNHHEQASAMAVEGYCKLSNRLAVLCVTTGPGGTNTVTGVHGAWTDSTAMLVLSGQVKRETTVRWTGHPVRQLGDQEVDIVEMVRGITKYAVMLTEAESVRYHLEKALYLATTGRPGPCWVDVPMDIQGASIDPESLPGYRPDPAQEPWRNTDLEAAVADVLERISRAERPVILTGTGVRISGRHADFIKAVERLGIPVTTAWNAHDALWNDHPLFVGRPGSIGDRPGNFAVQNADLLLVLGCRLNVRQVGWNFDSFARAAHRILVDIDELEMGKPTLRPSQRIHADLADFLPLLAQAPCPGPGPAHQRWLDWCKQRQARYPVVLPEYRQSRLVNPYHFMEVLFRSLDEDEVVVTGNGSACVIGFQAAHLKPGQRLFTSSGSASMGYDLPAAIGACRALGDRPMVCLTGDGSIMMNLQELQTIVGYRLPIRIFLINNDGYASMRQTQRNFFKVEFGSGPGSGVTLPDFAKVSAAFGLPFRRCTRPADLEAAVRDTLRIQGPAMCEVVVDPDQVFAPKQSSRQLPDGRMVSTPLEDLAPFLDREELKENMLIPLWQP